MESNKIIKSLCYAITEGNLQTHKYRFGIQPNNFKGREREIQWIKLI